ncbi:MAG TPA: peptidylprolyl isomerase [Thermoanaerobaculia bacterium]|jgi:parvulin-like peptidyl-prolyl isomerase
MKKALIALALSLSATTLTAGQLVEAIVVRVGDRIVTRSQYLDRLADGLREIESTSKDPQEIATRKEKLRKSLVEDIVGELLLKDRADRLGINVTEAEVKDAVGRLKQQYGISTDEQFDQSLKQSGMTRADMETRLRDTLITNKVFARELRSRTELSDRELRERYDREKERYRLPERAHLREIVILKPEGTTMASLASSKATDAATRARAAGADFAKLASELSESGTKAAGGDLGEIARGELLPDLDKAVFAAQPGSVIGPIESRSGWHILKVEQRLPSEVPAFESVKDRLRKDVGEESFQRDLDAYLVNLRKDAFIQVNEQNLPTV